jgi:hypothetical protein
LLQIACCRVAAERRRDSAHTDHAAQLLILLIAGGTQRLVEIFLMDALPEMPVKPFDYEGVESVETVNTHVEARKADLA